MNTKEPTKITKDDKNDKRTIISNETEDIQLIIEKDDMEAYICVYPILLKEYSVQMLKSFLIENKVTTGIMEDTITDMIENKIFNQEILVAKGTPPVFGKDGHFDVPYDFNFDTKPKILPDGSVDYNQFENFCIVNEGDVIARYIHATKGENGVDVFGKIRNGKNGVHKYPLSGKGFRIDENNKDVYIATMTGRLEYVQDKSINVLNSYEISSDVSHATGNVQFAGDIHIKGNIVSGMSVNAAGQIIVDGHVEAAYLYAGKDIVLKNGMQGAGKGIIEAKGNISGKFFEQVHIKTPESVYSNAILNCDIVAGKSVVVSGRIGALIGGKVHANEMIDSYILGNMAETKTYLSVGIQDSMMTEYTALQEEINSIKQEIEKYDTLINKLDIYIEKTGNDEFKQKKLEIIRAKFNKNGQLNINQKRLENYVRIINNSVRSKVMVHKSIYPGVYVNINGALSINKNENYDVTYKKRGDVIVIIPNLSN